MPRPPPARNRGNRLFPANRQPWGEAEKKVPEKDSPDHWEIISACVILNGFRKDPTVSEVARQRVMVFSIISEVEMFDALKKLIGADEEGKKRRKALDEEEQREREKRARQHAAKLHKDAEEVKQSGD